ncbi:MAG: hypothetical protein IPM54_06120 [Polyangiaceae bacterium]|nr:hypothetical protein [Polyangiaceae bacterium]
MGDRTAELEDPWWVIAIAFVPIFGDAFDLAGAPWQAQVIATADWLADVYRASRQT